MLKTLLSKGTKYKITKPLDRAKIKNLFIEVINKFLNKIKSKYNLNEDNLKVLKKHLFTKYRNKIKPLLHISVKKFESIPYKSIKHY